METKTCEEYVLAELRAALATCEALRREVEALRNAEPTEEPTGELVQINKPIEACCLQLASSWRLGGEDGLNMTAEEIRAACATRQGLELIAEKKIGAYRDEPLMQISKDVFPYRFESCGSVFGIEVTCNGRSIWDARIMPDSHAMCRDEHFPIERMDEMREHGLAELKALLLAYAEKLEEEQCSE